jgi:twitching motility protein PilT
VLEVLRTTGRVQDTIKDGDVSALPEIIKEGAFYGMMSFDQALYNAVRDGKVDMDTALTYATRPHDFKLLVQGEGRVGTTMEDVEQDQGDDEEGEGEEDRTARNPEDLIPGL